MFMCVNSDRYFSVLQENVFVCKGFHSFMLRKTPIDSRVLHTFNVLN
jgi:hypothetical protein